MSTMKIRAQAIKALEDAQGRVTAEQLFEAAQDRNHPLHNDFEWDKEKGWRRHNLDIARQIITSVRVLITTTTKKVSCVGYVRDPDAEPQQQGYVSVAKLRTEQDAAHSALLAEATRVQSMLERMRELAAGLGLEEELDAALNGAIALTGRLRKGPAVEERPSIN